MNKGRKYELKLNINKKEEMKEEIKEEKNATLDISDDALKDAADELLLKGIADDLERILDEPRIVVRALIRELEQTKSERLFKKEIKELFKFIKEDIEDIRTLSPKMLDKFLIPENNDLTEKERDEKKIELITETLTNEMFTQNLEVLSAIITIVTFITLALSEENENTQLLAVTLWKDDENIRKFIDIVTEVFDEENKL